MIFKSGEGKGTEIEGFSTLVKLLKHSYQQNMERHTTVRKAIIKKTRKNKHWRGCGKKGTLEPLYTIDETVN